MDTSIKHFNTNGIRLHYIRAGSGKPMIFIPGSISDHRTWTNIQNKFSNEYECYNLCRRFQHPGKYTKGGDSNVELNTEDISTFLKENKIPPAVVVGHSFGGFIALNLAIKYPELVEQVIAEEPIFAPVIVKNPKNPFDIMGLMFRNAKAGKSFARLGMKGTNPAFKALKKNDAKTAGEKFIDGLTDGKKTPDTLDTVTRLQLIDNIESFAGEDPFNNHISLSDLKKIQSRVLLLNGTESPYIFQYINTELKKRIKGSEHVYLNNCGHWMHIEQEDKFINTIASFLSQ